MKTSNKLWRKALLPISGLLLLQSASSYAARCEYVIQSEWNSGFVAAIRITNDTNTAINGWSVNWSYADGSSRTGGWNANFSGNNPYSASNVGWNGQINPGQTAEFGIQGNKGVQNAAAAKPAVTGAVCGGQVSSASSVRSSSSSFNSPSSIPSSSSSKSSLTPSSASPSSVPRSSSSSLRPSSVSRSSLPSSASRSSSSNQPISSSSKSSSSFGVSSSFRSSSSSSFSTSSSNQWPTADLKVTTYGLTVLIDLSGSTDPEGDKLIYTVSPGDNVGAGNDYITPKVWHTYKEAGTYIIMVTVHDQPGTSAGSTQIKQITVQPEAGNQAPIARLAGVRENQSIITKGSASFDPEGTPLTYEWDFGDGPVVGDAQASIRDCESGDTSIRTRAVALTVSDGELKDTVQKTLGGKCGVIYDVMPTAAFSYKVDGNKVVVDGSQSENDTAFSWNFGDGSTGSGLVASHTYAAAGTYDVVLTVAGPSMFSNSITKSVVIAASSSSSSIASSSIASSSSIRSSSSVAVSSSSSSKISSSAISSSSSSMRSSSSQGSSDRNRYTAPRATTAPVIDGVVDSVWERASWAPIDVFWLGTQSNPSAQDYSGRYKALWDENYLYILYDVTDDKIYDGVRDALDRYWEDDTVELFIDENKSGGQHGYNTSAWAYHISTYGDVVDSTTGGATLLNSHIDSRRVSNGTQHYWEMRIRIYGEDYADWKTNTPLQLFAGKLMGFSACYIDNDGSSQRESMMGSVDTQGHKNNQGYLDASVFGSMLLVE
ncbi:MAG: PKD domain-containing protein [Gammaproteobacteria bacterium]|nr:MAG: PKD domain-containing protein [Gammaproteobacteria bacterium]